MKYIYKIILLITIFIFWLNITFSSTEINPYSDNVTDKIQNSVTKIINKIDNKKDTLWDEKFNTYINNLNIKLNLLVDKFEWNERVLNIIHYLVYELNNLKVIIISNDITDICVKSVEIGDITLCDTWKSVYDNELNTVSCPDWYKKPNYYESGYFLSAKDIIKEAWFSGHYWTNSLMKDVSTAWDPRLQNNRYEIFFWWKNPNAPLLFMNSLKGKYNVLCYKWLNLSKNYINQCWVTDDDLRLKREYLLKWEEYIIEKKSVENFNWTFDDDLIFQCSGSNIIETVKSRAVSCKYWYILKDNDCIPNELICNLWNFWSTHPINWKICSWKNLETVVSSDEVYVWSYRDVAVTIQLNKLKSYFIEETTNNYKSKYNNKVDVKVIDCTEAIRPSWTNNFTWYLSYSCEVEWLIWQ